MAIMKNAGRSSNGKTLQKFCGLIVYRFRMLGFHPGERGSIPRGATTLKYGRVAKVAEPHHT